MEARYKPKRVVETSVSKKPRDLTVKRKTLRHSFRPPTEKKRDLPPLTPLHRLQRFKAIRDKNLKTKLRKTLSQNIFLKKMEESGSVTIKLSEKEPGTTSSDSVIVCPLKSVSTHEKADLETQNGELLMNGQNGLKEADEKVSNGHELLSVEKENPVDESAIEIIPNGSGNVSQPFEDAQEEVNESKGNEFSSVIKTESDSKESTEEAYKEGDENFVESDRESTASSSTFTSNKEFLQSSSDEMVEALASKRESGGEDENEEVDVDRISSTEDETKPLYSNEGEDLEQKMDEMKKEEREKEAQTIESKKTSYQSRIPRSLSSVSSASSYKSAYGSLSRISGRRPVMGRGRKRPAEDESSERRSSFSEPSPRWRFVRAVPGLWSTPNLPSPSTKCFRNIDDSMAVNVNEESINYNLNDPDLFSDSKEIPPSKKSRWGCRIM